MLEVHWKEKVCGKIEDSAREDVEVIADR